MLSDEPKIYSVLSGKGGVGKSTVSSFLAYAFSQRGSTLIIDLDICGPSITECIHVEGVVKTTEIAFTPLKYSENLDVLSFGSILKKDDAVIWRGPKKAVFLERLFNSAYLKDDSGNFIYEYVVIDTPPGISDEHNFLLDKNIEAFVVTTSQNVSLLDAQNSVEFALNNGIPIKGIIQNMSYVKCNCCRDRTYVYGKNGGKLLAEEYEVNYLGELELLQDIASDLDTPALFEVFGSNDSFIQLKSKIFQ